MIGRRPARGKVRRGVAKSGEPVTGDEAARPKPVIVDRVQLAALIGVHVDRITEYRLAGMPCLQQGGLGGRAEDKRSLFDAIAAVRWVRANRGATFDAIAARAALDRKRQEEVELRLELKRRELVPVRAVESSWTALVTAARNHLLGIPHRVRFTRPGLTDEDLDAIDQAIRQALEELAVGETTTTSRKEGVS